MLTTTLIAGTRAELAQSLARRLRLAARRALRRIRLACRRIAQAHRQRRELEILLHADDRMLADIGLTRAEIQFVCRGRDAGACSRADQRGEACLAANSGIGKLPLVDAPALAPDLPRLTITHENFR